MPCILFLFHFRQPLPFLHQLHHSVQPDGNIKISVSIKPLIVFQFAYLHNNREYTLSIENNTTIFCIPQPSLVGKTTKLQAEMQESCGVRSLISIIIILWLLSLSPSYTSFQHFNVSVREICHCVHPQNGLIRLPFVCICLKRIAQYETWH